MNEWKTGHLLDYFKTLRDQNISLLSVKFKFGQISFKKGRMATKLLFILVKVKSVWTYSTVRRLSFL